MSQSEVPFATINSTGGETSLFLTCPHCNVRLVQSAEHIDRLFGKTFKHDFCPGGAKLYRIPESLPLLQLEYRFTVQNLKKSLLVKAFKVRGFHEKLSGLDTFELWKKFTEMYPPSRENLEWIRNFR